MNVWIDSGPISATQHLETVPRSKWHDLMLARKTFLEINISNDCRCLIQFVDDAKQMFGELGFKSAEDMIRSGYELEPAEINVAIEWLRLNPSDVPVPMDEAVKLGRHGGDRRSEKVDQGCDAATLKRGTAAHWLARLDRDGRTELAAKVRAGEMSSYAAAVQLGWRTKRKPPSPLTELRKWWKKASADERAVFLAEAVQERAG